MVIEEREVKRVLDLPTEQEAKRKFNLVMKFIQQGKPNYKKFAVYHDINDSTFWVWHQRLMNDGYKIFLRGAAQNPNKIYIRESSSELEDLKKENEELLEQQAHYESSHQSLLDQIKSLSLEVDEYRSIAQDLYNDYCVKTFDAFIKEKSK